MKMVTDPSDSQGGMFSKQGRQISQKFLIFQHKELIMNIDLTNSEHLSSRIQPKVPRKRPRVHLPPRVVVPKKMVRISSALRKQIILSRSKVPPIGNYKPSFAWVEPNQRAAIVGLNEQRQGIIPDGMESLPADGSSQQKSLKASPKGPDIGKTSGREGKVYSRISRSQDAHQNRFVMVNQPQSWSRSRRVKGCQFSRMKGRNNILYKSIEYAPDYQPNLDFCRRRTGLDVPDFNSTPPRVEVVRRPWTQNEGYITGPLVHWGSNLYRNTRGFQLKKGLHRGSQGGLPMFMSKLVANRCAVNQLGEKSLELNNFTNSRFASTPSDFRSRPLQSSRVSEDGL